jgi:FixJ family two-component response regulator
MEQLTRRQNQVVSAIISYPDQEQAAAHLGIDHGTLRNTLARARTRAKAHNTWQLVHKWTLAQIADTITTEI